MTKIKLILSTTVKAIIFFIFFFTLIVILGFAFGYNVLDIFTSGYFSAFKYERSLEAFENEFLYFFIVVPFLLSFLWIFRNFQIFQKPYQWFKQKHYAKHLIIFLTVIFLIVFSQWGLSKVPGTCEEWLKLTEEDTLYRLNMPPGHPSEGFALGGTTSTIGRYLDCIGNRQNVGFRLSILFLGDAVILLIGILILYSISKKQNEQQVFSWFYRKKWCIPIINILVICLLFVFSGWNINKIIKIHRLNCEKYIRLEERDIKDRWTYWCKYAYKECMEKKQGLKNRYLLLFFGDGIILLSGISALRLISKRRKSLNNRNHN